MLDKDYFCRRFRENKHVIVYKRLCVWISFLFVFLLIFCS